MPVRCCLLKNHTYTIIISLRKKESINMRKRLLSLALCCCLYPPHIGCRTCNRD